MKFVKTVIGAYHEKAAVTPLQEWCASSELAEGAGSAQSKHL
jgi:hypothetical protein